MLQKPDIILNTNGSVYHIGMRPENLADTVIVVGDPERVNAISHHFTNIDHRSSNREFNSCTGFVNGKRITALSTGIGTDNCDIVMHELDALANFDLNSRDQKPVRRSLTIIRIGTSGSIQADVPVNNFGLSTHAVGLDNLMHFYQGTPAIIDKEMTEAFAAHASWPKDLSKPYFIKGSDRLINLFRPDAVSGVTVTAPGFYGPQGRVLRLPLADPEMLKKLQTFSFRGHRILNFEMETSALYGLGALMGHDMVTICALIANRATGDFTPDHKKIINDLISLVLDRVTR